VLRDNARLAQLNTPAYSMVAYPWAQTYQQSNQWALETLAMAQDRPHKRASARRPGCSCRATTPTTLHIGPLQAPGRAHDGGQRRLRRPPEREAIHDRIETVTVDSVFAWLNRSGLGGAGAGDPLDCATRAAEGDKHR
jgi:hypothetical protein